MSSKDETVKKKSNDQDYEVDTLTNERLIADHNYDGIQELDNDLPPWWKWLFILCVVFGIVYMVRFWVFESPDLMQEAEFEQEMASVSAVMPTQQSTTPFEVKQLTDATSIANGKTTFDKICHVCHLMDGGGSVGPNFTDDYWIHGNSMEDLFNVVSNGVLEKGMIPYKDQLSPTARLEVLSYIITLHGTTPAKPKAPQGDKLEWPY